MARFTTEDEETTTKFVNFRGFAVLIISVIMYGETLVFLCKKKVSGYV